MKVIAETPHVN